MRLCVGTSKGIVMVDPDRERAPLAVIANPSSIWCMAQSADEPHIIYVGSLEHTHMGEGPASGTLSRTTDSGRTWTDITPGSAHDEGIWAVAAPPDAPGELFIGTTHARLFRSEDHGQSFKECSAFLQLPGRDRWSFPPPPHIPHVRAITFDPANPSVMYVGVEEGGVFRSRNRGVSFEPLNKGIYPDLHALAVDPADSRRLYATTGRGFYRSDAAGASWNLIKQGVSRPYVVPLLVDAGDAGTVYTAGAAGAPPTWAVYGADSMLFVSNDGGGSFRPVAAAEGMWRGMVMAFLQSELRPEDLFAVTSDGKVLRWRPHEDEIVELASNLPPAYALAALP
ncbi:MAG TPA: hypothetical protein VGY99_01090 [Candidatus Binataceae bacterium]|jgi:photosystem II stability/assembly factor-like uncharacterized protein|nr:hypothetical protein [Candidatus Binataceae bacterium]